MVVTVLPILLVRPNAMSARSSAQGLHDHNEETAWKRRILHASLTKNANLLHMHAA